jgi:hypothetical protein
VRANGRIYEAVKALVERRPRCDLYHAALVVATGDDTFAIEVAPTPDDDGRVGRGVVATGDVGLRRLGRWRLFRYEVRCWPGGEIPDLAYAVGGPIRVGADAGAAARVLAVLPGVPTPTWGRDELHTGEMWNSNSVVAWALSRAGLLDAAGQPPANGRAPGWSAGVVVAGQQ